MADDMGVPDESSTWSLDLNLAGVEPASGKGPSGPQITKTGVYRAAIASSSRFLSQNGFDTVKFTTVIEGGDFDGYEQGVILPGKADPDKDPTGAKWKARWKALMLNIAKDPANLEKGAFKFGTANPKNNPTGKTVYIFVRVPKEGELDKKGYQKRPEANFMAPAEAVAELEAETKLAARKGGGEAAANGHASNTSKANGATKPPPPKAEPAEDPLADI